MKRFLTISLLGLFLDIGSHATHIVGGEMGLKYLYGDTYSLFLIFYYDVEKGNDVVDDEILVNVFKRSTQTPAGEFTLIREGNPLSLDFRNPECRDEVFGVRAYRYTAQVQLSPLSYSDPGGYYAVWQRCCRNAGLNNVSNSANAGMAFYMEFPSLTQYQRNSAPEFIPIVRESFCTGDTTSFDMHAIDKDGDQLRYSLVVPLRGNATVDGGTTIINDPGPYPPEASFFHLPGLGSNPGISINPNTGRVYLEPGSSGIFLFSIKCEEFRGGQKIGEVRREFELVVDQCLPNDPPTIQVFPAGWNQPYQPGDTIFLRDTADFCQLVVVSDPNQPETVNLSVEPSGYESIPFGIFPSRINLNGGSQGSANLCLPLCFEEDELSAFTVKVKAIDDHCPRGGLAILDLIIKPELPINQAPTLTTDFVSQVYTSGDLIYFQVFSLDPDPLDPLIIHLLDQAQLANQYGIQYSDGIGVGDAMGTVEWTPDCRIEGTDKLELKFLAQDEKCNSKSSDTLSIVIPLEFEGDAVLNPEPGPNVVTPNGDGKNDQFAFQNLETFECKFGSFSTLTVYDRWGVVVFQSDRKSESWDPGNLPVGTYYYLLEFESGSVKGFATLIR